MSKKILTEELIHERLEAKGIVEPYGLETPEKLKIVCEYYDAEIKHDYSYANMYFSVMSTADGYEIYFAGENESSPYFDSDIYYYESDWFEKLPDAIQDGLTIHIDEHYMDEYGLQDAVTECYEEYYEAQYEEVEEELLEEGYEYEKDE